MSNLSKKEKERRRYDVLSDVKCRKLTLWHSRTFTPILTHAELEPIMATIGFFPIIHGIPKRKQKTMRASVEYIDVANVGLGENAKKRRAAATGTKPATEAVTGTQPGKVPVSGWEQIQWREYELRSMNRYAESDLDLQARPWPRLPYPEVDGLHLASYLAFLAALESYVNPSVVLNLFLIRPIEIPHPGLRSIYKYTNTITLDSELDIGIVYFYRPSTLDGISEEQYAQLRESVGDISHNELFTKHVRKDRMTQTEEDEKDDSSIRIYIFD